LSIPRAAEVHALVTSRMNLAWAVASEETHSTSLRPGPRSSELAIALSAFSYVDSVVSPASLPASMIRSFNLRMRWAAASTRGSDAIAACAAAAPPLALRAAPAALREAPPALREAPPELREAPLREEEAPPERAEPERELRALVPLLLPLPLLLLRVVRRVPVERLPVDRVPVERLPVERRV
jgi:hypothetical protein